MVQVNFESNFLGMIMIGQQIKTILIRHSVICEPMGDTNIIFSLSFMFVFEVLTIKKEGIKFSM